MGIPLTIPAAQLLANDTDPNGSALSISAVGTAVNGGVTLNLAAQTVSFTATATGPASFTYTIKDALGLTSAAPATVSLTVNAVVGNQPPVANNDTGFTVTLGTPLTIPAAQLLANDSDPNGSALSISAVGTPVNGGVILNLAAQTVTFTATATGPASFTYTIKDAARPNFRRSGYRFANRQCRREHNREPLHRHHRTRYPDGYRYQCG